MFKTRFISILVLLCLTVSGAWAQEVTLLTTIENTGDNASFTSGSKTFDNIATVTFSGTVYNDGDDWGWYYDEECTLTVTAAEGYTITRVKFYTRLGSAFDEEAPFEAILQCDDEGGYVTKVNGTSIGEIGVTRIEVYGYETPAAPAGYTVSMPQDTPDAEKWTARAGTDGTYQQLPLEGVAAGTAVSVKYTGTKKVKSVKAVKKAAPAPSYDNTLNINTYDPESNNWEYVTVPTGKHWLITGTGEATTNTIIIANNATVTLSGVNITAFGRSITCEGNATIILADGTTNNLYSADGEWGAAGIEMSGGSGTSLTIQGNTGVLNITSGHGPAIGAGYGHAGCAINIEGGIINATSTDGPGIGAAYSTACGNITISGGTVAATGGYGCPGIGGAGSANCGDITITSGVTSVTATKGVKAPYSIGASSSGSCGTVTIEDPSKVTEN